MDAPATLTLGEAILVACCWMWIGCYWLQSRRRTKPASLFSRFGLPLLVATGVVGSMVNVILSIPIGR
jgi:hypothetical protein